MPQMRFRAFRDIMPEAEGPRGSQAGSLSRMRKALELVERGNVTELPLRDKVFAISTSYWPGDLRLVSEERPEDQERVGPSKEPRSRGSLLFNVCAWPSYESITAQDEAAWIKTCRILRFEPRCAGLNPWPHPIPRDHEELPPECRRYVACTTSAMREGQGKGFVFPFPGGREYTVKPAAFIFMGGRLRGFSGIMPGIMEEFLHAAGSRRPMWRGICRTLLLPNRPAAKARSSTDPRAPSRRRPSGATPRGLDSTRVAPETRN